MSRLSDIATEAFAHRLLPMHQEVILPAMHAFGKPPLIAIAAAAAGAFVASALLYGIGIWLRRMPQKVSTPEQQLRIGKLRVLAHEWLPWLLVLAPSPVGGMLIIASGFFAIPPWLAALAIASGELLWRLSPLM